MQMNLENIQITEIVALISPYLGKIILGLVILVIGWRLIKLINSLVKKFFVRKDLDPSLETFLRSFISIGLKALLLIVVAGTIGVEMTSLAALLGGAGVAIGMALSGTLQNFAGGAMILLFKPYKVGDFIEAGSYQGIVKEIQIFNTILTTPDNKTIVMPNAPLFNDPLINFSTQATRRIDLTIGIDYSDDIDLAKSVLKEILANDSRILEDPEPIIGVAELADNSVNIWVRPWVKSADYLTTMLDLTETIKKTFDEKGLNFPFPQRTVTLIKE